MKNYEVFEVPKGADQDFEIDVFDADDVAIDLTLMANTVLVLYSKNKTEIAKYSVTVDPSWSVLTVGGLANNTVSFRLLSTDTNLASEGIILYEIRTQKADLVSTDDSQYDSIVTDEYLCTIKASITSTLTLP